jgi:competence protein ComFC
MTIVSRHSILPRLGRLALDLLYPPRCALCRRQGSFLCDGCRGALPRADGDRCPTCWLPWDRRFCAACDAHPPAFSSLRAPYRYEGDVRTLVRAFKFGNFSALASRLGEPMVLMIEQTAFPDVLVPVPLSRRHQRERGYNQALILTRVIATYRDVPVVQALRRTSQGVPQSLTSEASSRRENVRDAFAVSRPSAVKGRRVLIVDDVATTGATLDACARVLLEAGADRVDALTFAREDA